jgi:hypothetical protein
MQFSGKTNLVKGPDDSQIFPKHLSLHDIYQWDILLWVLLLWDIHCTSIKLKKAKLLSGLTCVLKENYKYCMYDQKQNLEVEQIFVRT